MAMALQWLARIAVGVTLLIGQSMQAFAAPDLSSGEQTYVQQDRAVVGRLTVRPGSRSILFRIDSPGSALSSLDAQAGLLLPLLRRLQTEHPHVSDWFVVFRDSAPLFERIQSAAAADPGWDARAGRARQGASGRYIVQLINAKNLAREFVECFADIGYALRAKSVEQLLIERRPEAGGEVLPVSGVIGFVAERSAHP